MPNLDPDEERARRLTEVRARRGSPERAAAIEDMQEAARRAQAPAAAKSSGRKSPENSTEIFGHPWPVWFAMRDAGFEFLCDCARRREMTTSDDLWAAITAQLGGDDLGPSWRQMPNLIGYISARGHEELGCIPSALVTSKEGDTQPGPGFFRLAATLGVLPPGDAPGPGDDSAMSPAQKEFWDGQVAAMYDHFADHPTA